MKSFIFGNITDLWGDAPYTDAIKGNEGGKQFEYPAFDSQETIYLGVIEDLKTAAALFASADGEGVRPRAGSIGEYEGHRRSLQRDVRIRQEPHPRVPDS